jgi:hypothetical protein
MEKLIDQLKLLVAEKSGDLKAIREGLDEIYRLLRCDRWKM